MYSLKNQKWNIDVEIKKLYTENKLLIIILSVVFILLIIGLAIFLMKNKTGKKAMSKGGKNNPLNIRNTGIKWGGEITKDGEAFESFATLNDGIRAGYQNLLAYASKHNLTTIRGILYRWAPPTDGNDTEEYINFVSQRTGITENTQINGKADYEKIIASMSVKEGTYPVSVSQVQNALT